MGLIKFLFKAIFNLLILAIFLTACAVGLAIWSAPKFAPKILDTWLEGKTGFSVTVNKVDVKAFSGSAAVHGMTLLNPSSYQNRNFIQLNELSSKVHLTSLYKDRIVIDHVVIDIGKVSWVRNKEGLINIVDFANSFKSDESVPALSSQPQVTSSKPKQPKAKKTFIIKKLVIRLGELDVVGFPKGSTTVQSFSVNYNKEFTDVTDLESLAEQIGKDLSGYGIAVFAQGLFTVPIETVIKSVEEVVQGTLNNKATKEIERGVKKIFGSLKKLAK